MKERKGNEERQILKGKKETKEMKRQNAKKRRKGIEEGNDRK